MSEKGLCMFESRRYEDIPLGEKTAISRSYSEDDVNLFVKMTNDTNPLHISEDYALTTRFRRRIVPGMLVASMISGVLGTKLPGYGTIYMSQELKFVRPVYLGDRLTCEVEVVEKLDARKLIILDTKIVNQEGKIVISGRATVMLER